MGVGKEISRGILQLGQHSSVAASNTLRWAGPRMAGRGQKQANRSAQPAAKSPGGARLGRQRYFEFTSRRKLPISNAPKDFRHGPVVYVGIATYEWRATLHQCCRTTYKENLSVSFPPHLRSNPDVCAHFSFRRAGMKPGPRSVNLALAGLFKHPLSRVVPNPCVAEYTGGLTKFGTPTTPRGDNFTAEQLTKSSSNGRYAAR